MPPVHAPDSNATIGTIASSETLTREMVRFARLHSSREDLACDAVQDALLLLWQRRTPPSDIRRWLRAAVMHRCRHHARTHARAEQRDRLTAANRLELDALADPACAACTRELCDLLNQALNDLPPLARRALELRAFESQDYEAIARRLRVPLGTVRSTLHRARAALRLRFADWLADGPGP